jgi:hypothetical protein
LEPGEVGGAISIANNDLAIHSGSDWEGQAGRGELGEGASQVVTVSAEEPNAGCGVLQQSTEPIELGLVASARATREARLLTSEHR